MEEGAAMDEFDRRRFLQAAGAGALALGAASQLELAEALAEAQGQASGSIGKKAIRQLRSAVKGKVLTPGSEGYGSARKVFNTRFDDLKPPAVVEVEGVADVQAVFKWADKHGIRVTARSGGHSYGGYSINKNGVIVDLRKLGGVRTSDGNKRATVGAGVPLIQMYSKLAKQGLTVPGGSCPTVGVTGLALGGGMGFAARKLGMTSDTIAGVGIVTPDGRYLKVNAKNNPGLLWACQGGGGGNFGIVTSLTFETHAVKRAAYFHGNWPWEAAGEALDAWQRLVPEGTHDLSSTFSLLTGGEAPFAACSGQYFGSESDLRKLLQPLAGIEGAQVAYGTESYGDLMLRWAGCEDESLKKCSNPHPRAFYAGSDYVAKHLNSGGRKQMLAAIEARQGSGGSGALLCDAYGGAINQVGARQTAFVHRDQLFAIQYYAEPGSSGSKATNNWVKKSRKRLSKYTSGQAYQNYIDPSLKGWKQAYYGKNYERLVEIKTRYDPDNRLRFRQGIPPKS